MKWEQEPNRVQFQHQGIDCLIVRHPRWKHLCGYCNIPAGHPHHGKPYQDLDYSVHGGLTFSNSEAPAKEFAEGEFWIGFDCAHCDDYMPGNVDRIQLGDRPVVYRDIEYVTEQCKQLAEQIVDAA